MGMSSIPKELAVSAEHLDFSFGGPMILHDVNFKVEKGSRCLLVGANGAGKSTLLRLLAGKTLTKGSISVLGKNPFTDGSIGITYLGTEWAHNPVVKRDVPVSRLLMSLGANRHQERCAKLLEIMNVDPNWHMHQVSDGQRRRVQIVLGLMEPWNLLLLDEVTVDLDVVARSDLLEFLKQETIERNATIIYATHIFDGISEWATHIAHMTDGTVEFLCKMNDCPEIAQLRKGVGHLDSPLLKVVLAWLRKDEHESNRHIEQEQPTKWDILSENMKQYGDKYYNYWR